MADRPDVVTTYLDSIADDRRRESVAAVDGVIRAAAPELEPFEMGTMLGYGPYHYVYESGREGDTAVVAVSNQKAYVSVYLCAPVGGVDVAQGHASSFTAPGATAQVSVGKGCIRFRKLADIDLEVLGRAVQETAARLG